MEKVIIVQTEETKQTVPLPCGCSYVTSHKRGQRMYTCNHCRRYIITAIVPRDVDYEIYEVKKPRNIEDVNNYDLFG